eukprot:c22147_g1_i1 orf=62-1636(-)
MVSPESSSGVRKFLEDFSPAGLHVLVVDDDPVCLMVLERMLRCCNYRVTTCNRVAGALELLRDSSKSFDLVLSDVYMPDDDGFKLLEVIGLELDLPVIMMSANGETSVVLKGITHGACDYLIKPVRMEELRNIWQHVVRRRGMDSPREDCHGEWDDNSRFSECPYSGSKKRKEQAEFSDYFVDDISSLKKARVNWSVQLHQQFVNAVNLLGIDKAVPKKILEIMNVHGLTRENVASHLQKYRLYLKRLSGAMHEPFPVASFQASQGGNCGGYMQVHQAGKSAASTSGVKGTNLGVGIGADSLGGRSIDPETMNAEFQYTDEQQIQIANRTQILGGLGIVNGMQQVDHRVSYLDSSNILPRTSSLDLPFMLESRNEEVLSQLTAAADSLDDITAFNFKRIVNLQDFMNPHLTVGIPIHCERRISGQPPSSLTDNLTTGGTTWKNGTNSVKMELIQENSPASYVTPAAHSSSSASIGQDCTSTTVMGLSQMTHFSDTVLDVFTDFTEKGDSRASSFPVDEFFSNQC